MATDISQYIDELKAAKNGAEMRMPIAKALRELSEKGNNVDYLLLPDGTKLEKKDLARMNDFNELKKKLMPSKTIRSMTGVVD